MGNVLLCPLVNMPHEDNKSARLMRCVKSECAWWVIPYTNEGLVTDGMCAIQMIAMRFPANYQV